MINPQWLKLPKSRRGFHALKDVQAIEVPLYEYGFALPVNYSYLDYNFGFPKRSGHNLLTSPRRFERFDLCDLRCCGIF